MCLVLKQTGLQKLESLTIRDELSLLCDGHWDYLPGVGGLFEGALSEDV